MHGAVDNGPLVVPGGGKVRVVLWIAKRFSGQVGECLVRRNSGAVQRLSPPTAGSFPGDREAAREPGNRRPCDGSPVSGGGRAAHRPPSNRHASAPWPGRGPCISYMEGPRPLVRGLFPDRSVVSGRGQTSHPGRAGICSASSLDYRQRISDRSACLAAGALVTVRDYVLTFRAPAARGPGISGRSTPKGASSACTASPGRPHPGRRRLAVNGGGE